MPTFHVDPERPSDALEDCRGHLAMIADLLSAHGPHGVDLTVDGVTGLCDSLRAVAGALGTAAECILHTAHAFVMLAERLRRNGLIPATPAGLDDVSAALHALLDSSEAEAANAARDDDAARIAALTETVRASRAKPPAGRAASATAPRLTEPRASQAPRRRAA